MILNPDLLTNKPSKEKFNPKKKSKKRDNLCPNCGGPFFSIKTNMSVCGFNK